MQSERRYSAISAVSETPLRSVVLAHERVASAGHCFNKQDDDCALLRTVAAKSLRQGNNGLESGLVLP